MTDETLLSDGEGPDGLLRHRRPADFRGLVPGRLGTTTVATVSSAVVGFVAVPAPLYEKRLPSIDTHRQEGGAGADR